jgi:hypothetical protein
VLRSIIGGVSSSPSLRDDAIDRRRSTPRRLPTSDSPNDGVLEDDRPRPSMSTSTSIPYPTSPATVVDVVDCRLDRRSSATSKARLFSAGRPDDDPPDRQSSSPLVDRRVPVTTDVCVPRSVETVDDVGTDRVRRTSVVVVVRPSTSGRPSDRRRPPRLSSAYR